MDSEGERGHEEDEGGLREWEDEEAGLRFLDQEESDGEQQQPLAPGDPEDEEHMDTEEVMVISPSTSDNQ